VSAAALLGTDSIVDLPADALVLERPETAARRPVSIAM